jgi:predicted NBD/HSP70 family sugar kinase
MSTATNTRTVDPLSEARGRPLSDSVLELLWRLRQASRAELARQTGLSRSTVSEIVTGLLATKLIAEVGDGPSRGGRRPVLLAFQDDANVILGVDMGASHVSVALTDLRGQVLCWRHADHQVRMDPEGTTALISDLCQECLDEAPGAGARLMGIGVAVPCPVNPRFPDRLSEVVLPAWAGFNLPEALSHRFEVPVFIDNDANLGALAEHWWGAGRGLDDFAYVKVATGVGAGYMIRGQIYRGATGVAGEIGHMTIDPAGAPCVCGNRGCLATFVGSESLVDQTRALLDSHPDSLLAGTEVSLRSIEDAAIADDPLATQVMLEAANHLGSAIAGVLNLMNPGAVILGGGLSRLGEQLVVPVREAVMRRTLLSSVAASRIEASELGPRSIALGAATLVLDRALATPSLFPGVAAA